MQLTQTPPLTPPVASYTVALKTHSDEWLLQSHTVEGDGRGERGEERRRGVGECEWKHRGKGCECGMKRRGRREVGGGRM